MALFDITYTVNAESKNDAMTMAYSSIYLADLEVEQVSIRERKPVRDQFTAFGDFENEAQKRIFEPFEEKGFGDV